MNQFITLLKKEIKELLTPQLVLPMVAMMVIFSMIGDVLSKEGEKQMSNQDVYVVDLDKSETTKSLIKLIEGANYTVIQSDTVEVAKEKDSSFFFVIPQGFEKGISEGVIQKIDTYNNVKSLSLMANIGSQNEGVSLAIIQEAISTLIISNNVSDVPVEFVKSPIVPNKKIIFRDKVVDGNITALLSHISSQTTFVPIILFIVTTLATQLVATAVATEKENKTLETLLSTPINRKLIVASKLIAAALVSLLMASVYMVGMRSYVNGIAYTRTFSPVESCDISKRRDNRYGISNIIIIGVITV